MCNGTFMSHVREAKACFNNGKHGPKRLLWSYSFSLNVVHMMGNRFHNTSWICADLTRQ